MRPHSARSPRAAARSRATWGSSLGAVERAWPTEMPPVTKTGGVTHGEAFVIYYGLIATHDVDRRAELFVQYLARDSGRIANSAAWVDEIERAIERDLDAEASAAEAVVVAPMGAQVDARLAVSDADAGPLAKRDGGRAP